MTPHDEEKISSIGSDLLDHAKQFGEENRLPLTTQLFPFLLMASRRMTTREMSSWLEKEKDVKLSAAGISKGLQRPDLHLRRIAEHVHPQAAYIAAVYFHCDQTAESILFEKNPATGKPVLELMHEVSYADPDGRSLGISEAFSILDEVWASIPEEVQFMCRPYFRFDDASDFEKDSVQDSPE